MPSDEARVPFQFGEDEGLEGNEIIGLIDGFKVLCPGGVSVEKVYICFRRSEMRPGSTRTR
jgi:hypothetical protein